MAVGTWLELALEHQPPNALLALRDLSFCGNEPGFPDVDRGVAVSPPTYATERPATSPP